jgi:hypothetical protein
MKKLIAISVVFALVAGVAFAVDLGGTVIGTATIIQGDNGDGSKVTSSGGIPRVRLEGSGEAGDGAFGGWLRFSTDGVWGRGGKATYAYEEDLDGDGEIGDDEKFSALIDSEIFGVPGVAAIAWWKPIDQFKLSFGGNPDGVFAKEGNSCWSFYQMASDSGVTDPSNAWGGTYPKWPARMRAAFFEGFADQRVFMTITPAEIADINIAIPFIANAGEEAADVFKKTIAQVDLKFDFGNIALTYQGNLMEGGAQPKIFAYYGGSFGAISLDFGIGYEFAHEGDNGNQPIGIGVALKYGADSFGVKFRAVGTLAGDDKNTGILAEVLPYFILNDTMRAFVAAGLNMKLPDVGDSEMDWHFNPWLEVGNEWGPCFYAGVKVWSANNGDLMSWGVPIGLIVSF